MVDVDISHVDITYCTWELLRDLLNLSLSTQRVSLIHYFLFVLFVVYIPLWNFLL